MISRRKRKKSVIDREGFRINVGIVLVNSDGLLFLGKRAGQDDSWQFPQGGILPCESLEEALFRELNEEVGLTDKDVQVVDQVKHWVYYRLPKQYVRYNSHPVCIGQKQKWFLLRMLKDDSIISLDQYPSPEFDGWQWVDQEEPIKRVVDFKRHVYREVMEAFEPCLASW